MLAALLFALFLVVPGLTIQLFCGIYNYFAITLPERRRLSRALRMEFRY